MYIDPPYNTSASSIPYKNNYKHSSFATMIRDRVAACHPIMSEDGAIFVSIDKVERGAVQYALDDVFGDDNNIEELIWTQATSNGQLPNYSTNHEYVEVYAKRRDSVEADKAMFREPKPGCSEVLELVAKLNLNFPSVDEIERELKSLYSNHRADYKRSVEERGMPWDAEAQRQDSWKGFILIIMLNIGMLVDGLFQSKMHELRTPRYGFGRRFQPVRPPLSSRPLRKTLPTQTTGTIGLLTLLQGKNAHALKQDGSFLSKIFQISRIGGLFVVWMLRTRLLGGKTRQKFQGLRGFCMRLKLISRQVFFMSTIMVRLS
ncbi:DNA methyltransferase [Halopseudomonas pachastrellae]|nr:DNA methyltransferase [Halopseudomonas pachastrellae]